MENEQSQLQKLFKPAEEVFTPQGQQTVDDTEEIPEDIKNRHVRRQDAKIQALRKENTELAAKYAAITEASKFRKETGADELDEMVSRIYGTDKPENAAATDLLLKSMKGFSERAKREALEEFRAEQTQREQETQKEVATLEGYIEEIEDQYGVDLSSTASAREKRSQYIELLEKLSPKQNGEVVGYADPFETYELFASRQAPNRAKELSIRGMVNSRAVDTTAKGDATAKFLREQGLLETF